MSKPFFYAAAANSIWKQLEAKPIPELRELIPFLAVKNKPEIFVEKVREAWFIDSSAFSIFTTGAKVTLDDYIAFLKKVLAQPGHKVEIYAGLDVIGDPVGGDVNQLKMEDAGLKPMATYHRGDNIDFLKKFLDRGYEYIAIGGMAIADEYTSAASLFPFLDSVYREICSKDGRPRIKTHLFGIGAPEAILRYPCTSSDSAHWMSPGAFGSIMFPKFENGKPNWFISMNKVAISVESRKFKLNENYKTMKPQLQEMVRLFVESYGFDVKSLQESYEHRNLWNLRMALEVNKNMPSKDVFDHMEELSFNFL